VQTDIAIVNIQAQDSFSQWLVPELPCIVFMNDRSLTDPSHPSLLLEPPIISLSPLLSNKLFADFELFCTLDDLDFDFEDFMQGQKAERLRNKKHHKQTTLGYVPC